METYIGWRFPESRDGNLQGSTRQEIECFKGKEIKSLVRETCQNSLDAKNKENTRPVRVVFELRYLPRLLKAFTGYSDCIERCRKFWQNEEGEEHLEDFLLNAEHMLERDEIPVLVVSDYNTEGLTGSHSEKKKTAWNSLTGSDGISHKTDAQSGGSFGIGKNAAFACSALNMVFYNTFASDEYQAFTGEAKLASMIDKKGEQTQGTGKYRLNCDEDYRRCRPLDENDKDELQLQFQRSEVGTDVIVAGFNQEEEWEAKVEQAALTNFFVAIQEGKLVVQIKGSAGERTISQETIAGIIEQYADTRDKNMARTYQLYAAFTKPDDSKKCKVIDEDDVEFFIKTNTEGIRFGAQFQRTGMFISRYTPDIMQDFAALLVVRGEKLAKILRAAEPPTHDKWQPGCISGDLPANKQAKKDAASAINIMQGLFKEFVGDQFQFSLTNAMDAVGVAAYLPSEDDATESTSQGDDVMAPQIKLTETRNPARNHRSQVKPGMKGEGSQIKWEIHNNEQNPDVPPLDRQPQAVDPEGDGEIVQGITEGAGTKELTQPGSLIRRAFPVDVSSGLYKIIVKSPENLEHLYFHCFVLGEDRHEERLELESFTCNGKTVHTAANKAGPLSLMADVSSTVMATFKRKEKLYLRLRITELVES